MPTNKPDKARDARNAARARFAAGPEAVAREEEAMKRLLERARQVNEDRQRRLLERQESEERRMALEAERRQGEADAGEGPASE